MFAHPKAKAFGWAFFFEKELKICLFSDMIENNMKSHLKEPNIKHIQRSVKGSDSKQIIINHVIPYVL